METKFAKIEINVKNKLQEITTNEEQIKILNC